LKSSGTFYNVDWKIFNDASKGLNVIITFSVIRCKKSGTGLLDPENEGNSIFPKVGKLVPDGMVQHHWRLEISVISLASELFQNSTSACA
jgi:hypothetical protein